MTRALTALASALCIAVATLVASGVLLEWEALARGHGLTWTVAALLWSLALLTTSADILIHLGAPRR